MYMNTKHNSRKEANIHTKDTYVTFSDTSPPTNIILQANKHNIPKGKMHNTCKLLPEYTTTTI